MTKGTSMTEGQPGVTKGTGGMADNPGMKAQIDYMLAVIYSRQGKNKEAVERYLKACELTPSYWHRGNLDPEISELIKKYGLNQER